MPTTRISRKAIRKEIKELESRLEQPALFKDVARKVGIKMAIGALQWVIRDREIPPW